MANNSFAALMQDVNAKISEMNTAASKANSAAAEATTAGETATEQASRAQAAAGTADAAATKASGEATKWENAKAEATTLASGESATAALSEEGGAKKLTFGIPRGADGATGPQGATGPMGKSGWSFSLNGNVLYITTT